MMRDTASIAKLQVCTQPDGSLAFFFGNTTIRAVATGNGLLPLGGDQVSCGEWYDLGLDEVEEYLKIIEKHIFQKNL
jgi:hypothetical protein